MAESVMSRENPFVDPSDGTSTYDGAPVYEPMRPGFKKYLLYYTTSRLNVTLHLGSSSNPATYYCETQLKLKSPQLLLRRGDAKTSPMVSFARLQTTSRHMLLGKGDYNALSKDEIAWEELHREKNALKCSDYTFSTKVGGGAGGTAAFRWRKDTSKTWSTVYDCVDERERVVARLFSGGMFNFKKGGEVDVVVEGLSQDLEECLLMSSLAIWSFEALDYHSILQGYESGNQSKDKQT
ncbi:hypothetical protein F5Y15DRAFT_381615 [Xylariaceae sp. FL0016]|nr:hypothetical protein F5Y15DRAFT_381615 [Xylariaceae sp. FL0016]